MLSGFGHIRAGEALLDYAKENIKSLDVNYIDICDIDPELKRYAKIYEFLSKRFPILWDFSYKYLPVSLTKKIVSLGGSTKSGIIDYIDKEDPDTIIFTNVVIVPMFINILKKRFPKTVLAVLVTDYHAHPYYVFKDINRYFVGHEEVKEELVRLGVKQQRVIVSGIPINPRFYIKQSIPALKKKYETNNGFPVVLLIASFRLSVSKIVLLVRQILSFNPRVNLIFIANGNKRLSRIIERLFSKEKRLKIVLWTNKMEEYIKISDVVITKAGGLTVSECLAIKKPMIILNPIPGQEEHNASFVEKNGLGKWVKNSDEVVKVLPDLLGKDYTSNSIIKENPSETIFKELGL